MKSINRVFTVLLSLFICSVLLVSVGIVFFLLKTADYATLKEYWEKKEDLPTIVLDIHGRYITEFFAEQKRELITIDSLPKHLIYALITREDQDFYLHNGFSLRGFTRGVLGVITRRNLGGGSTITQQLVGQLGLVDRSQRTAWRKLVEIWYAIQIERYWSKDEILEKYINWVYFGHNNYGIEAASQFYFQHSAREITIAESAILVIQLANPSYYSIIRYPDRARTRQIDILQQMVNAGYISQEEADASFEQFWNNYDYNRDLGASAFFARIDKAPYFSEHIRYIAQNKILLGDADINTDGYTIYTTLDLDMQEKAMLIMRRGIVGANLKYAETNKPRAQYAKNIMPIFNLLGLTVPIENMYRGGDKQFSLAEREYKDTIVPVLDVLGLLFSADDDDHLRTLMPLHNQLVRQYEQKNKIEGALLTLDNATGRVLALVGGSQFSSHNQFNRALQGYRQPGSLFKPLYYIGAIDKEIITPSTIIYDAPIVFAQPNGEAYMPLNFLGTFAGAVRVRNALAHSRNIPSIKVLDMLGFNDAIEVSSRLLGITPEQYQARRFVHSYALGLGIVSASPLEIAQAFATIANMGKKVEPIFIRYIKDRNGVVVAEPEREAHIALANRGNIIQIVRPEAAYVMIDIMRSTTGLRKGVAGTLTRRINAIRDKNGKRVYFDMPIAGKTGTTQNWVDAWTAGFTPYYTSVVWLGFDAGSRSLGLNQTGATAAGPLWAQYMYDIHIGLEKREFPRPAGVIERVIVPRTGLLAPANYNGKTVSEVYIEGSEPTEYDTGLVSEEVQNKYRDEAIIFDDAKYNNITNVKNELTLEVDSDLMKFEFLDNSEVLYKNDDTLKNKVKSYSDDDIFDKKPINNLLSTDNFEIYKEKDDNEINSINDLPVKDDELSMTKEDTVPAEDFINPLLQ